MEALMRRYFSCLGVVSGSEGERGGEVGGVGRGRGGVANGGRGGVLHS